MREGERPGTGGAGRGIEPGGGADSWRGLGRRAVQIARQRQLGGKALLLGAGAIGGALAGALLAGRGGALPATRAPAPERPGRAGPPVRRGPAGGTALVWVVVRWGAR
jgi:hypothetical protein